MENLHTEDKTSPDGRRAGIGFLWPLKNHEIDRSGGLLHLPPSARTVLSLVF